MTKEKKRKEVFLCGILRRLLLWEFISLHIFINNSYIQKHDGHQRPLKTPCRTRPGVLHGEKVPIVLGPENSHRRVHAHLSVSGTFYITFEISKILSLISACSRSYYSKTFHLDLAHTSDDAVFLFLFSFVFRWLSVALVRVS